MTEILERNQIEDIYKWDLSSMYPNDKAWEEALSSTDVLLEEAKEFSGKLGDAKGILEYLNWNTNMERQFNNLYNYASLRATEDSRDSKAQSMEARVFSKIVKVESCCAYAVPEILSLDEDKLREIIDDETVRDYKFILIDLLRSKSHTLSDKEEILLSSLSEALSTASKASDMLLDADMIFEDCLDKNGNKCSLGNANYIPYQMSEDRVLRENSFKTYYKSYKQYIHTLAATYNGAVTTATSEAKIRHYSSSREMSMAGNNIPVSVYDNLVETVHKNMHLMYRYVALRKKILGIDDLHYYDVYAPLSATSSAYYTYDQAKQMVVEAVKPFGDEYVKRVKMAYTDGWIDVYPNKGKPSGAFSSGSYDSNPFIKMNFNGTLDSVSTLAHEMGHSQHTWLTNHNQPYQYSNYSLFVAEVASTVNENLLIDQLLKKCDEPRERLTLLNEYLEGFKGTVYRQTMFAEFEMKAHALKEKGESLDADTLNRLYKSLVELYFGKELIMDEEVQYEWARIPHFYSPFYVYVYATGYASAVALGEEILNGSKDAVNNYLEFLSMGSSKYPLDELKHAGVDLTTPEPIEKALKKFERILDDAEKTFEMIKEKNL